MLGFYKDAVCRTVFSESLCDCWGSKRLQWWSGGKGRSCAESTLCGAPRPLCIVSFGRWHSNASAFSHGTLSASGSLMWLLASQSEAERKNLVKRNKKIRSWGLKIKLKLKIKIQLEPLSPNQNELSDERCDGRLWKPTGNLGTYQLLERAEDSTPGWHVPCH